MTKAGAPPTAARRRAKGARRAASTSPPGRTIVHVTAEYHPYARTGGLAEAVAGLATFQARAGHRVVVFLPLYSSVREVAPDLEPLGEPVRVVLGDRLEEVRFFSEARPSLGPEMIFVDAPVHFARAGLYGELGTDYPDNHRRFALFSRAALEGVRQLIAEPVLMHAHDWHSALVPVYMHVHAGTAAGIEPAPVVLSVHNAGYQGHFPQAAMQELGLPWELWRLDRLEWYGHLNMLKGGLTMCDVAVTVSPTHAEELRTVEGGFGLDDTFRQLGSRLVGICNGIDQGVWDPATDTAISAHYARTDLAGKAACKDALQRTLGLPRRTDVPLIAMTARLVKQKGFDIILTSRRVRELDAQFVFLGTGEPWYHAALADLVRERPQAVAVEFGFTDILEHRLIAGADILLMPSLYEPCGLTQMRAQRYGALVIGRRVGGIRDTVEDGSTGFLFDAFDASALDAAFDRAVACFADRKAWARMVRCAMEMDFGWERSAALYGEAYRAAERLVLRVDR
ncbi:MAG: glycogen synthase [Gemmatimonadales bacterium]